MRLSLMEQAGAVHADVRIPLWSVRGVRVAEDAWSALRGLCAPGTGVPGVVSLGTRRGGGIRDFVAVYSNTPPVVISSRAPARRLPVGRARQPGAAGEPRHRDPGQADSNDGSPSGSAACVAGASCGRLRLMNRAAIAPRAAIPAPTYTAGISPST